MSIYADNFIVDEETGEAKLIKHLNKVKINRSAWNRKSKGWNKSGKKKRDDKKSKRNQSQIKRERFENKNFSLEIMQK